MKLEPAQLRRKASESTLGFRSTEEVEPSSIQLGQSRAQGALDFAMSMGFEGYNIYALGVPQIGMHAFVQERLKELAEDSEVPQDCCYLNNFGDPSNPYVCLLPDGTGRRFKTEISQFITDVRTTLPAALTSDEYRKAASDLTGQFQQRQMADASELQKQADQLGLTMLPTPNGFAFAPVEEGKVMEQDRFAALDDDRKRQIAESIEQMNQRLIERLREYPKFQEQLIAQQRKLLHETADKVLTRLSARLRSHYQMYPPAVAFVAAIRVHLLENVERIIALEQGGGQDQPSGLPAPLTAAGDAADRFFKQYQVNLLIDNAELKGAPVIYESNPSLDNLVGKLEHRFEYGTPVTDFSMIRPGALHRANGGYLLLDTDRLLQKPFAWEALKRALTDGRVRVESVSQLLNMAYSISLEPEPVPLNVKVILLGNRQLYQLLRRFDPDFDNLFKILADFDDYVQWNDENQAAYAAMLSRLVHESNIRHLTAAAVASTLEHSSRLVDDRGRLSARMKDMEDILREADQLASQDNAELIDAVHIDSVILNRIYRLDRIRELIHENITRGITVVETEGRKTGQINGLSVVQIGKLMFGQPSRITATARVGKGEVIDIEREARLGGNIHTKAVMIVSNFIGFRYAKEHPLSLHASLVFEQSYGGIEGDSASIAEVCALISAIIDRPLRQDLAVTGSMDQHGKAQAIGGVNQKIEGFYDICKVQGITGNQGVIIPLSNVDNLMLRQDVVDAVAEGQFNVYTMDTVDDAMAVLFAEPGGSPVDPAEINTAVSDRVAELHGFWMAANKGHGDEDPK